MARKSNYSSSNSQMAEDNNRRTRFQGAEYKYEVADELGVTLGADTTSRDNGRVGGEITKSLVNKGKKSVDTASLKNETASELGVELGPDTSSRANGSVGGSMTKKLVNKGKKY